MSRGDGTTADMGGSGTCWAPARMPRVDAIWNHPLFQEKLRLVREAERDREFCRHGLGHLLDVARIAWIRNLEEGSGLDREEVYAAALLHDIGRAGQYALGIPHDEAGEQLAAEILGTVGEESRFCELARREIAAAVAGHRRGFQGAPGASGAGAMPGAPASPGPSPLADLIAWADKASRPCYACDARGRCYWPDAKKNLDVRV